MVGMAIEKGERAHIKNYNCNKVIVLLLFYDHVYGRDGEREERLKVMESRPFVCFSVIRQ